MAREAHGKGSRRTIPLVFVVKLSGSFGPCATPRQKKNSYSTLNHLILCHLTISFYNHVDAYNNIYVLNQLLYTFIAFSRDFLSSFNSLCTTYVVFGGCARAKWFGYVQGSSVAKNLN
jgi:hypothetical protein